MPGPEKQPTIEDLASNINIKYWKDCEADAEYLERVHQVPREWGFLLSMLHDFLFEFNRMNREDE